MNKSIEISRSKLMSKTSSIHYNNPNNTASPAVEYKNAMNVAMAKQSVNLIQALKLCGNETREKGSTLDSANYSDLKL